MMNSDRPLVDRTFSEALRAPAHTLDPMPRPDATLPPTAREAELLARAEAAEDKLRLEQAISDGAHRRARSAEAERDKLRELIFGVGVDLWDRAELSERDEAGNQTILLWHPSGQPLATLGIRSHSPNLTRLHLDLVMSDLLDVFVARERTRAALKDTP